MTSSGIVIHLSVLTSCSMRFIGKTGASMSGLTGFPSGPRGGFILMSARILYHCLGISSGLRKMVFVFMFFSSFFGCQIDQLQYITVLMLFLPLLTDGV